MKFNSILLSEYKRVIFMDSDGLANANLDHLFFLPFPENIFMAAPQGYWFGKDGVTIGQPENYCIGDLSTSPDMFGVISSILLVIEPNQALYDTLQKYFGAWIYKGGKKSRQYFDMD